MAKAVELKQKRSSIVAEMNRLVEAANHTNGVMSSEAEAKFVALDAEQDTLKNAIARAEKLEVLGQELDDVPTGRRPDPAARPEAGFSCLGELIYAVRFRPTDRRLSDLPVPPYNEAARAEQEMETGAKGGFMVPAQMGQSILQVQPQEAVFADSRVGFIPAGDPPDAAITFPALNQTSTKNMYGGVEVSWIAEGGTKSETDVDLKEVTLTPKEVAGFITVSDKLLRNWRAASSFLEKQLRLAIAANRDDKSLNGSGVGCPLGVLKSPALLTQVRGTGSKITFADVVAMRQKRIRSGSYVWIASDDTEAELLQMEDNSGKLIFIPSARDGEPDRLLGHPVLWNERSPSLGAKGDLVLADLSHYLWKAGSGPFVAASEHLLFKNNKTVIKAFANGDGQPWLSAPVKNEGGRLRSSFIALDVPAA